MANEPSFPGRSVRAGDGRRDLVRQVQERLEALGCGPIVSDGIFGAQTRAAVQRFQARRGLLVDGVVGAATWQELFEEQAPRVQTSREPTGFGGQLLKIAVAEVGARESGGPNRGPRVDEYLRNVGLDPTRGSFAWCAAFVYFCFTRAASALGLANPCVKTAGVMNHWYRSPERARVPISEVRTHPDVVPPGAVFIVDHGKGKGHTGLVEVVSPGMIQTIEGNTNAGGSREGDGVYRRTRPLAEINKGFIDYTLLEPR